MTACVQSVFRASTGKANGDRLSSCIRDLASVAASKGISTAASALCQALVELDKILAIVESTSLKYSAEDQFIALVSLFDVVARGVLLCLEDTASSAGGRYDGSLETLRGLVAKAKEIAARLCPKGRLSMLSRKKQLHVNLQRDLEDVSDAIYRFAASHKPELAASEHHYVSLRCVSSPTSNILSDAVLFVVLRVFGDDGYPAATGDLLYTKPGCTACSS